MKFNGLQILRGIAALLVVLFHISGSTIDVFEVEFLNNYFKFGSSGVEIFFVLSGFIIAFTAHKNIDSPHQFLDYLKKRITRLYPIYWVVLIALLLLMNLFNYSTNHQVSFLKLLETFLLTPDHVMINGVSWSLSFEIYFYLLFGLLILSRKFFILILTIFIVTLLKAVNVISFDDVYFNFLFSENNFLFIFGVIAAIILKNVKVIRLNFSFLIIIILTSFALFGLVGFFLNDSSFSTYLYGLLTFIIILSFCYLESVKQSCFDNQLLVSIGDASYVLYLIHLPIIRILHKIINSLDTFSLIEISIINILIIIITVISALIIYRLVELPLIKYTRFLLSKANSN